MVSSVAESEAVKKLVAELQREIDAIHHMLLTASVRDMPDVARELYLNKRDLYKRVISYFDVSRLKQIEKDIDENLHNL